MTSLLEQMAQDPTAEQSPRARILQVAHQLFYSEGIRATGVDRLIAAASVTKTTFYRHFPSKHDLILAFLKDRHEKWLAWFDAGLQEHGGDCDAIIATLDEWFSNQGFRGCAFINSVCELGGEHADVVAISQSHKKDVTRCIEQVLPPSRSRKRIAGSISLAIDGAIIRAQMTGAGGEALALLKRSIKSELNQLN